MDDLKKKSLYYNWLMSSSPERLLRPFRVVALFSVVFLISCTTQEEHHLLDDAQTSVYHTKDTIGWSNTLHDLHGLWVNSAYLGVLDRNKAIHKANEFYQNEFIAINIDSRRFRGDTLEIVGIGPKDRFPWEGVLQFPRENTSKVFNLKTKHPGYGRSRNSVYYEDIGGDTVMTVAVSLDAATSFNLKYRKITREVSDRDYHAHLLEGVEYYMREQYIKGNYAIYNMQNEIIYTRLKFANDGTLGEEPFTRYHIMAWDNFDVIMFEKLPDFEYQKNKNTYFGVKVVEGGLELYEIDDFYSSQKTPSLGALKYILRRYSESE